MTATDRIHNGSTAPDAQTGFLSGFVLGFFTCLMLLLWGVVLIFMLGSPIELSLQFRFRAGLPVKIAAVATGTICVMFWVLQVRRLASSSKGEDGHARGG